MTEGSNDILDQEFMKDAREGLDSIADKSKLELLVSQLNRDLLQKLEQKKARKEKRKLKEYPWIYFAVVLILLLLFLGYWVISKLR